MKKFHRLVLLGALALVAVAVFAPISSANHKAVDVKVGEKVSFDLPTKPSAGYSWRWTTVPEKLIAKFSKPKTLMISVEPGATQMARITITGVAVGSTSGVLSYIAPDGTTVRKTKTVNISVSGLVY